MITTFYETGLENYKNNIKEIAIALRLAMHAKEKEFKDFIGSTVKQKRSKIKNATKHEVDKLKSVLKGKS